MESIGRSGGCQLVPFLLFCLTGLATLQDVCAQPAVCKLTICWVTRDYLLLCYS